MKKKGFPAEILCLFFIISVTIMLGKILTDVKNIINLKINELIPQTETQIDYNAYSFRTEKVYEDFKELNIIRNIEDLKNFKQDLVDKNINIDLLDEKLNEYTNESFDKKTLVILNITNNDNITVTRITNVSKKNNNLVIRVNRHYKNKKVTKQYSWMAVLELDDYNSQILLNCN